MLHMFSRARRVSLLAIFCVACASDHPPKPAEKAAPIPAPAPTASAKPIEATKPAPAQALTMTPQPGWVAEEPSSAMRKAQFRLPHADSDSEDASLVVYYFVGQGGTREANLERWAGQFEQPDGSPSGDALRSSTRKVGDLEVFEAALSGTYVAETAPGSGVHVNKPGWRMQTAIIDASDGPWYFKLVGPEATVAKWNASYVAYLDSVRPGR
jgi:hypothetical protein